MSGRKSSAAALAGKRVVAASGIADPDAFVAQVKATGAAVQVATWKDHHDYRDEDVAWLAHAARRADHVVITEKDAVKLRDRWPASVPEPLVAVLDLQWEDGGDRIAAALDAVVTPVERPITPPRSQLGLRLYDHRFPVEPRRHPPDKDRALPRRGESLRGDDVALRLRGPAAQPRPGALQGAAHAREADHRLGAGRPRQRRGGGVHRLSRAVQHLARAGQGRHPLRHRT